MKTANYPSPRDMDHLIHILSSFTNYEQNRDFHKGRVRFDLKNMERLCAALGEPQAALPAVHVTGSKGKGSTALMVTAILEALGLRTGTFTSPHLQRMNERIAINGSPLPDPAFVRAADEVLDVLRGDGTLRPTFFEFITATAMAAFRAGGVEAAVYEVGLGGRLDSTNVIRPEVAVITAIEREHCAVLGETEDQIAREKSGIIKKGIPVVTGVAEGSPGRRVIEAQAASMGAPFLGPARGLDVRILGRECRVVINGETLEPFEPPRPAALQGWNAACALAASRIFASRRRIEWNQGIALTALSRVKPPGRFEVVEGRPLVVVDGAHTLSSIRASLLEARDLSTAGVVTVLGLAGDKAGVEVVDTVVALSREVIFTPYPGGRACPPVELLAKAGGRGRAASAPKEALRLAREAAGPSGLVLITGSFYLAGETRNILGL